ncbi:MAG: MDR family MFS transporter [Dehalococcoidales bacterium]
MTQYNQIQAGGLSSLPRKQIIITFAGVLLAMFLSSLDQTIVGTAMPRIIADLGGFTQYTWVTTAYIITSAVAIPITGKLTDMYGRKYFYLGGIAIFVLASVACGLSNTMVQIIIFRGVQGIGGGVMMANAFTVIGDLFPPAVRGKYQGIMSAVFGLSAVIGPTLGGYITDNLSWHWVFFVNVPLGLLVITLFVFFFPHIKPDNLKHTIDYPGVACLVLMVVPLLLALTWGGVEYPWGSAIIIGLFAVSVVALGLFLLAEQRAKEPLIPLSLFQNRIVTISFIMVFLTSMGMFGAITFIPLFFQGVLGATATASGNFVTPMMLGTVTGSFLSGQALSRIGGHYKLQGVIGVGIMMVGMFLLSRMNIDTTNGEAIRNMIIAGFGLGITMPLYTIAVQNAVPYKILGVATSSTAFFRSIGGSVGLAIFGSVMSNRFAAELLTRVPQDFVNAVPPDQLSTLAHNPEALMSSDAQAQLQGMVSHLGDKGPAVLQQVLQAMRESLALSISHVFLYSCAAVVLAFIINFFIKEIPLRTHHGADTPPLQKKAGK